MVIEQIESQFLTNGFTKLTSNIRSIRLFARADGETIVVAAVADDCAGTYRHPGQFQKILEQFQLGIGHRNEKRCEIIGIVITDNLAETRTYCEGDRPFWMMDQSGTLVIYDNQPDDFWNMKSILQKLEPGKQRTLFLRSFPWVTAVLIAINLVVEIFVFAQSVRTGSSPLQALMELGIGDFHEHHEYWKLISSAFLHYGWVHFFNNMILFGFLGYLLEKRIGRLPYLLCYLICAVGANVVSVCWYSARAEWSVTTAGASGAVFGLVGLILFLVLKNHGRWAGVGSRQLIAMVVFTLYNGISGTGVNNSAHVGGFLIGLICGAVLTVLKVPKKNIL